MRPSIHRVRSALVAVAAILALVAVAAPVTARSPEAVTIVSHVTFNPDGPNFGDFTASGPAVDDGLVCATGTFVDTGIRFAGFQSGRDVIQIHVDKEFTCDDGSGTFPVKLQIQADVATGIETFTWVARAGTDAYTGIRGAGSGSTVPEPPTGNINTYEGFILD